MLIFLTIVLIAGILLIDNSNFINTFMSKEPIKSSVLIDAGHGGLDGGAVSSEGLLEAPINLAISVKLRDLFGFLGISATLTRTDAQSLNYNPDISIHANKVADLNARLELAKNKSGLRLSQYPSQPVPTATIFRGTGVLFGKQS